MPAASPPAGLGAAASTPEGAPHGGARQADTGGGTFEVIDGAPRHGRRHRSTAAAVPLGVDEWRSLLDASGRLVDAPALWLRVYSGGVAPEARREVWPLLLGVLPLDSTAAQRTARTAQQRRQYDALRRRCKQTPTDAAAAAR